MRKAQKDLATRHLLMRLLIIKIGHCTKKVIRVDFFPKCIKIREN